jgi:hypothetical protein
MDHEAEQYFANIAPRLVRERIALSDAQRRWWAQERRRLGVFMARENPTFLDECWTSPVQGSIYAAAIDRARAENRVTSFPIDHNNPVHTAWDLGSPRNTVVTYFQCVGREIRIIDCDRVNEHRDEARESGFKGTIVERVSMMLGKGYNFGRHYLPHDAETQDRTGATLADELRRAGLTGLVTVPRTNSPWLGINQALQLFPSFVFRSPQCDELLDVLACYRTKRDGALSTDEPQHDFSSHTADSVRTLAEAHRAGLISFKHASAAVTSRHFQVPGKEFARKRMGCKPQRISYL